VVVDPDDHRTWRRNTEKTVIDEYNLSIGAIFPGEQHGVISGHLFERITQRQSGGSL